MKLYEKWLHILGAYFSGKKVSCPFCGKENLDHGYVLLDKKEHIGYGAVWCKDCNHAFNLSRADVKNNDKVLSKLPSNLIFS